MAFKDKKPGAGRFASGEKFKGRASSAGNFSNNRPPRNSSSDKDSRESGSDRPSRGDAKASRPYNGDRTAKFKDEGKKVYNRSERFTRREEEESGARSGGDRRDFSGDRRASFKSGPKFTKSAPYKSNRRFGEDKDQNTDRGGSRPERSENPERTERRNRSESSDDNRSERPHYGERRNTESGYAARGERRPASGGARRPYPAKPYGAKTFGDDVKRTERKGDDNSRPSKNTEGTGEGSYGRGRSGSFNREAAAGSKRPFDRARPGHDRNTDKNTDRDNKRSFRSRSNEPAAEAPTYDLKRYQSRENRSGEKKDTGLIRLNRYIANAGICSRREADSLIAAGEIKVNGQPVTEMGYLVKPEDTVTYGKKRLNREKMVYVLLNKPKDFITTTEDPEGRKTVMDLVANASKERIFPVGRLDRNTTGLLLFTNDGELAQKLTHPSNNISKIYQVELDKPITREHFDMIVNGLELEDGKAEVDDLAMIGNTGTFLGIQIHIGKNRIVRRIFEHLGYEVISLDRVQYAGLTKKDVPRGKWRFLTEKEVIRLKYFL